MKILFFFYKEGESRLVPKGLADHYEQLKLGFKVSANLKSTPKLSPLPNLSLVQAR
jgi:hypothetical protein